MPTPLQPYFVEISADIFHQELRSVEIIAPSLTKSESVRYPGFLEWKPFSPQHDFLSEQKAGSGTFLPNPGCISGK